MNKLKRFSETAFIFFLGNVFTKMLSFLLLPLYTSRISPSDFGKYGLSMSILSMSVPFIFFCIWDSLFRFSFDYEKEEKFKVINDTFFIMILGIFLYCICFYFIYIIYRFKFSILIFIYGLVLGFQYYYSYLSRALQKNKLFVISGSINSLIMMSLNIILITKFNLGVRSLYISVIIGALIQIGIIESKVEVFKNISIKKINSKMMKKYLFFSIPITFSAISNWLLSGLTQFFIMIKLGSYYNGLYGIANKFSSVVILLMSVFQFAWNELAYTLANDSNKKDSYEYCSNLILELLMIGVSLLILIIKLCYPVLINSQYYESIVIIPILMIGTVMNSYGGFLGTIFLAEKKTRSLFKTTIGAGIINFIGLQILIINFRFIGAVLSLALSFLFYVILRLYFLKKEIGITIAKKSLNSLFFPLLSVIIFYRFDGKKELLFGFIILLVCSIFYKINFIKLILRHIKINVFRRGK